MSGVSEREATAALRAGCAERLKDGFRRLVEAEAGQGHGDARDLMINMTPFVDCARRLGVDPLQTLGPIAGEGPPWFQETFATFVGRTDVTLAAFGWSLVDKPDGPTYRFAW